MIRGKRWFLSIGGGVLAAAGLFLCWKGLSLAVIGPRQAEANYAQVRSLTVLTAADDLRGLPDGQRVLVSGRVIDGGTGRAFPLTTGGEAIFVVYAIYRTDRSSDPNSVTSITSVRESEVTPSFALQLSGGAVRVVNRDYALAGVGGVVGAADNGRQVVGHIAGGNALVDATIVQGAAGPTLRARAITTATPEDYIRDAQPEPDSVAWAQVFGFVAGLLGALLVFGGLGLGAVAFGLRRARVRARPGAEA